MSISNIEPAASTADSSSEITVTTSSSATVTHASDLKIALPDPYGSALAGGAEHLRYKWHEVVKFYPPYNCHCTADMFYDPATRLFWCDAGCGPEER